MASNYYYQLKDYTLYLMLYSVYILTPTGMLFSDTLCILDKNHFNFALRLESSCVTFLSSLYDVLSNLSTKSAGTWKKP